MTSMRVITSYFVLALASVCEAASIRTGQTVAFSVGLSHATHVAYRDVIDFNKVFVNEGNGYDPRTGAFVCPTPGLYIFHFHAYDSNMDKVMWLELLHNDQFVVSVSGYNSHSSGGNSVILQLNKMDRVQVKARDQQEFTLFGLPDQIYSTFSGYLLAPTDAAHHDAAPVG